MILYIDIENKKLVQSPTSSKSVGTPEFMQGDNEPIEIHLLEAGDSAALYYDKIFAPEVDFIKVAIARFSGTPTMLSYCSAFDRIATGGVNVTLPLNTTAIETAVGTAKYIDAYLEVEYSNANGKIRTVLQTACRVRNDLIENAPSVELQDDYYTRTMLDGMFARKAHDYAFIITTPPTGWVEFSDADIEIRDGANLVYKTSTHPLDLEASDAERNKFDSESSVYFSATGIVGRSYFDFIPYLREVFGSVYRQSWTLQSQHRTQKIVNGVYIVPDVSLNLPDGTAISSIVNEEKPYVPLARKYLNFSGEDSNGVPAWTACQVDSFSATPITISELSPTWTSRAFNNLQSAQEYALGVTIPANTYALVRFEVYPQMTPSMSFGSGDNAHTITLDDLTLDEHNGLASATYGVVFTPSGLTDAQLALYYPTGYWTRYAWNSETESLDASDFGTYSPTGVEIYPDFYDIAEGVTPVLHSPANFGIELKSASGSFEVVRFDDYYGSKGQVFNSATEAFEESFDPRGSLVRGTPAEGEELGPVEGVSFDVKVGSIYETGENASRSMREPFAIIRAGASGATLKLCVPQGATGRIMDLKILNWAAQ